MRHLKTFNESLKLSDMKIELEEFLDDVYYDMRHDYSGAKLLSEVEEHLDDLIPDILYGYENEVNYDKVVKKLRKHGIKYMTK